MPLNHAAGPSVKKRSFRDRASVVADTCGFLLAVVKLIAGSVHASLDGCSAIQCVCRSPIVEVEPCHGLRPTRHALPCLHSHFGWLHALYVLAAELVAEMASNAVVSCCEPAFSTAP